VAQRVSRCLDFSRIIVFFSVLFIFYDSLSVKNMYFIFEDNKFKSRKIKYMYLHILTVKLLR
jgi:hypothetical protein